MKIMKHLAPNLKEREPKKGLGYRKLLLRNTQQDLQRLVNRLKKVLVVQSEKDEEKVKGLRGRGEEKKQKMSPLDRNRAGDLSVSINSFTAERDSQLHHKGISWLLTCGPQLGPIRMASQLRLCP